MANIYDITNSINALWQLIDDMGEMCVSDERLIESFENATGDLKDKLEGYSKFIKNIEADIMGLGNEIIRLTERKKDLEAKVDRAKRVMKWAMDNAGEKKLVCGNFTLRVQNSPPSCVVDVSIADIPTKYLVPQEPKVDKRAILEDLKNGDESLSGIAHIEQKSSLRIG